jgi:hypothetical protein
MALRLLRLPGAVVLRQVNIGKDEATNQIEFFDIKTRQSQACRGIDEFVLCSDAGKLHNGAIA